ncbi:hypothetical protein [Gemmatimonas sp.]|uniref:hypothetical protein n=1 Tax=Gemmatimonas sp. TaxID=1962908 RepID=UPI00286E1F74|nr:hypothetical protein [Gemmatimonas sp.]
MSSAGLPRRRNRHQRCRFPHHASNLEPVQPKFGYAALGAWAFDASLDGYSGTVRIIERPGAIRGVQARNVLLPDRGLVMIIFTNRADVEFRGVWQGRGLS